MLAQKVLLGETNGYRNHPQLNRFKALQNPVSVIRRYLYFVYEEAVARNYNFGLSKIGVSRSKVRIEVSNGQIAFETKHLLEKLRSRDAESYSKSISIACFKPHPIFDVVEGNVADWEIIK